MKQYQLDNLEQVELRKIWNHEAYDFTEWLSREENISLLQDELEVSFSNIKVEDPTGRYNADITAFDDQERKVIIENQLETTDHKHLGQLLTYASGFDASLIIWIVKDFNDEHVQAIDWFNRHMPEEISFFLIKVELWKIGNSNPAPKFNIIAQPNEWTKMLKKSSQGSGYSELKLQQQEFWERFKEYVNKNNSTLHLGHKARPQHWYEISIGTSMAHLALTFNSKEQMIGCEIFIKNSAEHFEKLKENRDEIESQLGYQADFQELKGKIGFRVMVQKAINPKNRDNWDECFQWLMEKSRDFKKVFAPYF